MASGLVSSRSSSTSLQPAILFFIIILFLSMMINADHTNMIINNVADFGAKGDGKTDASRAFLRAWAASCSSMEPSTVYVPRKKYLLSQTIFRGPCKNSKITFRIDGILIAPDFKKMGSSVENWLMFDVVEGVSVIGGFLDGQGSSLYACKAKKQGCLEGPTSLAFYSSKDILVQNLTSLNAKLFHIVVHTCANVVLEGVKIRAPKESPNTDGIHIQNSFNVRVFNTGIKTGDDCISIGPGTQNLWVQRVACGPGHGISIGSLAKDQEEEGVQNVTVKNVVFTGTQNGLRIKSWGRPSNGFVRGVVFRKVVMNNVQNPIVIDQNYCPRNEGCPGQHSGIQISQVTFANIKGTSATQVAMKFDCSKTSPCNGINVEDVKLTYHQHQQPAESFCRNVRGVSRGLVFPPSCL
ncbi:Glycoside hydrolase [Macleaya cordata]|uniref:Glycoside hydrolase n=1 Tax=Macleaya cordata TaxID=56857 RepID=A0A200QX07_MACCD|nr:Glycoside hydrolase [Macleaya cordata]